MLPIILLGILILGALASYLPVPQRRVKDVALMVMVVSTVLAVYILVPGFSEIRVFGPGSVWYLDGLTAMVMLLVASLYASATVMSRDYLTHEHESGIVSASDVRHYYAMVPVFVAAMYAATLANNVGLLWIALEATILSTTLLVSFYRKRSAIEAAWKYVVLCTLGVSLGLVGVLLTTHAAGQDGVNSSLLLSTFREVAANGEINIELMRWAFVFVFIGLGTKVGFVPMHTWLPDAHSKTPAPISALLSGILLTVVFLTLLRFRQVTDAALGDGGAWTGQFFLVFGCLSVVVPALVMLTQKNYKRLLAYSSVEHMGLMAFAIGLGPAGIIPAVMHIPGHALLKSSLFFGAGKIFSLYKTNDSVTINDVWLRLPKTATLFLITLLMLLAIPPSAMFASQILIIGFGLREFFWPTIVVGLSLTLVSLAMIRHLYLLLFGANLGVAAVTQPNPESWGLIHVIMSLHLLGTVALGIFYLTPQGLELMVRIASSLNPGLL